MKTLRSTFGRQLSLLLILLLLFSHRISHAQETGEVSVDNTSFSEGLMDVSQGLAFSTDYEAERKGGTSARGILRIWDLSTGLPIENVNFPARIFDIKIDRDTKRIAVLGGPGNREETDPFAAIYDYATRRTVMVTPPGLIPSRWVAMVFGPDGNSLWLGPGPDADEYQINEPSCLLNWDAQGVPGISSLARSELLQQLAAHTNQIPASLSSFKVMDFDRGLALVGSESGESAEVWDAETGEKLFSIGHRANPINSYLLAESGKRLMAWQGLHGRMESIFLWDFESMTYQVVSGFPDVLKSGIVEGLGLSSDGKYAAMVVQEPQEDNQGPALVTLFKLAFSGESVEIVDSIRGFDKVLWDASGRFAIIWQGQSVSDYDLDSGQAKRLPSIIGNATLSVSPDRNFLWREFRNKSPDPGPSDQGVELMDIRSGTVAVRLPSQSPYFTQNIHVDYFAEGMLVGSECKVSSGGYTHSELNWVSFEGAVRNFPLAEPDGAMLIWSGVLERNGHPMACTARSNGILEVFDLASGATLSSQKDPQIEGWFQNLTMNATVRSDGWAILPRKDGGIRFMKVADSGQFDLMADLLLSDKNRWLLRMSDGHYWTSPDGEQNVFITRGGTSSPIAYLDIAFHRPHEVARQLGALPSVVEELESSWRSRMRRHGLEEAVLPNLDRVPLVKCTTPPPLDSVDPIWTADLSFEGLTDPQTRLHVLVNEVPIHGMTGIALAEDRGNVSIPVPLSMGINELEIFLRESSGLESLHWKGRTWLSASAVCATAAPRLHILAVGVSDYQNDDFDLAFAAKDARDLAAGFQALGQQHGFSAVITTLVLDRNATREGILKGCRALTLSTPDDTVIVSFAGHGITDEKGDYFFGTHDFDPYTPSGKGLSYPSIQSIFDAVPARKRLMFLDTCQAGELEETELAMLTEKMSIDGRGVKVNPLRAVLPAQYNHPNRLLRDMFSDLRVDTGAHVLCGAQGAEFAMESGDIGNGFFTHFLLKKILTGEADLDSDGQILVPELIDAVATEVSALTAGDQNPVLRESNRSFNFPLWPDSQRRQDPREFVDTYFELSQRGDLAAQ